MSNALARAQRRLAAIFAIFSNRLKPGRGAMDRVAAVPLTLQIEAAECGAASLTMVLSYYGRWASLEQVRQDCGVSRDGSKASNILKAAKSYGMSAKGYRKEPDQLGAIPMPAIIHWNFNHFVVLEGIENTYASIADPAGGRRRVPAEEFAESFTGVVLAMEPGPDFTRGGTKPQPLMQLLEQLRSSRNAAALVALFSLALVVPGLIVPGLSKLFIDKVMLQGFQNWVQPLCLGLVAAALAEAGIIWLQQHYLVRIEAKLSVVLSSRVMTRLMEQSLAFIGQRFPGELAGRVEAADNIAALLSGQVASTAFNLIAVVMYGGAMLMFDPGVAMVAFLVPAINLTIMRLVRTRMRDLNSRVSLDSGKLMGRTVSSLSGLETIKVSGAEGDVFAQWSGQHARVMASVQSLSVQNAIIGAVPGLLSAFGMVAVLSLGGLRVIHGEITLGTLVAIMALMTSFIGPLNSLMGLFEHVQHAIGDLNRLSDLMSKTDAEQANEKGAGIPGALAAPAILSSPLLSGRLELRDLSFGYSRTDPPLIRDFSLSLEPGMRVALVGGSGSGKSTIGRMVAGLLQPWSGDVMFDGVPRSAIPPRAFASSVCYVDQDVFLFEGTIRENLTLWDPTVPESNIVEALKDAEIHADVTARAGRYDAMVTEGGLNFSGGQRQRLEIARALVPCPSILILDEATAALDPITEQRIDQAIRRRGCTCLIIAHRLSAIRDADEIIVLRKGVIAERGDHDTLLAAGNIYASLIQAEA